MTVVWDTTIISRLYRGSELERILIERSEAGEPVVVAAPTIMEVVRGLEATATARPPMARALTWFVQLVRSDLVETLGRTAEVSRRTTPETSRRCEVSSSASIRPPRL